MRSIINILENDSALTTLIGANKVGMGDIPQGTKTPFVVVVVEDSESTNTFDAASDLDFVRFSVFSVADRPYTYSSTIGAQEVSEAVRTALDLGNGIAGTYDTEAITRCTHERMGGFYSSERANKPQHERVDEYKVSVRV